MNEWTATIRLDSPEECEAELQRVTNALALADHTFYLATAARDEADDTWEEFEARAAGEVHEKGITATVLRGRVTTWCVQHPDAMAAKKAARDAHTELERILRFYRSLEQRATNAQAALKRHLGNARYGGTV